MKSTAPKWWFNGQSRYLIAAVRGCTDNKWQQGKEESSTFDIAVGIVLVVILCVQRVLVTVESTAVESKLISAGGYSHSLFMRLVSLSPLS